MEIMPVSDSEHTPDNVQGDVMPEVDLARADLSTPQRHDLNRLIWEFRDLFVSEGGFTGRTSVIKHTIRTEGSPIRQPLRRIPFVLQDTVKAEIKKMLQQGVQKELQSLVIPSGNDKEERWGLEILHRLQKS